MLNDCQATEIECIFMLIDNGVIPPITTSRFIEWLEKMIPKDTLI